MKSILTTLCSLIILSQSSLFGADFGSSENRKKDEPKTSSLDLKTPFYNYQTFKLPAQRDAFDFSLADTDKPEYGAGKNAMWTSILLPGVGLKQVSGRGLIYLPLCYGLVGGGTAWWIFHKGQATSKYNQYLNTKNQADMYSLVFESNAHLKKIGYGQLMIGIGGALWICQAFVTYRFGKYNELYKKRNNTIWKESLLNTTGYYERSTRTFSISTRIRLK